MVDIRLLRDAAIAESNNGFNVHDNLKTLSVEGLKIVMNIETVVALCDCCITQ